MTRAVRTAQFGYSSLRTSATYKESKEARLSLSPYRTRKSENGESRLVDSVCAGIDSRRAVHPMMSKERLFSVNKSALLLGERQKVGVRTIRVVCLLQFETVESGRSHIQEIGRR